MFIDEYSYKNTVALFVRIELFEGSPIRYSIAASNIVSGVGYAYVNPVKVYGCTQF